MDLLRSSLRTFLSRDLTFFYVIILAIVAGAVMHITAQPTPAHALPPPFAGVHADAQTDVRGHASPFDNGEVTICHVPPGNPNAAHTKTVGAPAVQAHLAHGDTQGACRQEEEPPEEDTTPPEITNLRAEDISTSTAMIRWNTDEPADSTVYASTSSPVDPGSAIQEHSTATTTDHTLALSGPSASTTYHYIVTSTDEAGNTATSSERSFTTETESDETAPTISDLTATSTTSTTAEVMWDTDEPADSIVYYSTSSPVSLTTFVSNTSFVLGHTIDLMGLAASTTYHYFVTSTDEAGNTATSTEETFMTP